MEALFADYAEALAGEMERAGSLPVKTIYVGGGTPTVLPLSLVSRTIGAARSAFDVTAFSEVTIEANPGTVDAQALAALRSMGVTRLSLGVQSFSDSELQLLGRIHTGDQAVQAFLGARQAGFQQVSVDLIYGLPGQTLAEWQASLEIALALHPEHLSLYALSVEDGTPLADSITRGDLPAPDPDLAAEMYELAESLLSAAGYLHYEISNWAAHPTSECQHNLVYWRNEPYLGVGAGAHSWLDGHRRANLRSPAEYVALLSSGQDPTEVDEEIGPDLEMGETMMLGLRLVQEGVEFERFRQRFGVEMRQQYGRELDELEELGLLVTDAQRARLSERGRLLANQVFLRFLPD
jgi:oxygen-independent coproporphyrinogen-3 oxidase